MNLDVPAFAYGKTLPSSEAHRGLRSLSYRLPPPGDLALERVRIMEDPTLYADCTGLD